MQHLIEVPHLEWHITHNCNLSCESCCHFTNHGHNWFADIDTLKEWYSHWNKRISIKTMGILGGEPLLHKNIIDIIYLTKEMWQQPKDSIFGIVTNGILIDEEKHKDLPKALKDTNGILSISLHAYKDTSSKYHEKLVAALKIAIQWKKDYGIKIVYTNDVRDWLKVYNGFGVNSEPFEDNDFQQSWDNCPTGQDCFQLYEGNLYKCSLLAYLPLQKQKYGSLLSEKWDKYLKYRPLTPDCSDEEIIEFFNRKSESVCSMCPKNPEHFRKSNPLLPISHYE